MHAVRSIKNEISSIASGLVFFAGFFYVLGKVFTSAMKRWDLEKIKLASQMLGV
jgi:folate-dependent phosphoribosylglycinamide formyltransferase PurN